MARALRDARLLVDAGVPEPFAQILADSDHGISRGEAVRAAADILATEEA